MGGALTPQRTRQYGGLPWTQSGQHGRQERRAARAGGSSSSSCVCVGEGGELWRCGSFHRPPAPLLLRIAIIELGCIANEIQFHCGNTHSIDNHSSLSLLATLEYIGMVRSGQAVSWLRVFRQGSPLAFAHTLKRIHVRAPAPACAASMPGLPRTPRGTPTCPPQAPPSPRPPPARRRACRSPRRHSCTGWRSAGSPWC